MNKSRILFLAALVTAGFAVTANAAGEPGIKVDFDNGIVTISGQATDNESVFLEVLKPDENSGELDSLSSEAFNHVEQTQAENGRYSFKYKLDGDAGTYTVFVKGGTDSADKQPWKKTFNFELREVALSDLGTLNDYIKANDKASVEQFLEDNADLYFEDALYYSGLSDDGKEQVAKGIIADGEMDSMADAKAAVIKYSVIQELYESDSDIERGNLLCDYAEELKITEEAEYPFMTEAYDAFIENLGSRMNKNRLESYEKFMKAYKTAMCLTGIKNAENYGLIKGIIKRAVTADIISVPKYMALSSTDSVDKKLVKMDFATASALEDKIEELSASSKKPTPGGNGGGNYGSGNSSEIYAPSYNTNKTTTEEKSIFTDLALDHWAYESVLSLNKLGALNGYEDGSFKGGNNVTRREFLKIALIAFGIEDTNASSKFNDIADNDWAYKWIATAQTHGIISGDEKGNFNGDANVTRQDAAKILSGILTFKSYNLPAERTYRTFTDDSEIADYAFDSVELLYSAGVLNGMDDGTFRPKSPATRAESAKMIFSVLQRIGG